MSSNLFLNYPKSPIVLLESGAAALTADYNGFFGAQPNVYSDGRKPSHDLAGTDPQLTNPRTTTFDLDESTVWTRNTTTANVLSVYRMQYAPKPSSPVLGAGDPATTSGNWIGAIGTGQASMDRFGLP